MDTPLSNAAIKAALKQLPGWLHKGNHIEKAFSFPTFPAAIATMVRISFEAERLNHHPDWTNCYTRLTIRLSTHDAGDRITAKDVQLARRIEAAL
jgi:4a-hydroxytetrahydrobiopterin dehydratase